MQLQPVRVPLMTIVNRDLLADPSAADPKTGNGVKTSAIKGLKTTANYRVRLFDEIDRCVAGQFVHCENDSHARSHAEETLGRSGIARVEVWDGQRQVYQKEKRSATVPAESRDDRSQQETSAGT